MNLFQKLFGGGGPKTTPPVSPPLPQTQRQKDTLPDTKRQPIPAPVHRPGTQSSWRTASPAEFVISAAVGAAYCRIPLTQIPDMAERLSKELLVRGVPSSEMTDLFGNSLLGVCPECRQYCAGGLMLSLATLSAIGGVNKVTFMTDRAAGGPKQRLLSGQCGTTSCSNRDFYHLFWCPDLHPEMFEYLKGSFGIALDPGIQRKRDHIWKPQRGEVAKTPPSPPVRSEEERKKMWEEFHRIQTDALVETVFKGMDEKAALDYCCDKAGKHVMRTYGISFDELRSLVQEGDRKWNPLR